MARRRKSYGKKKQAQTSDLLLIVPAALIGGPLLGVSTILEPLAVLIFCLLFISIISVGAILYYLKNAELKKEHARMRALAISQIDELSGIDFENYISAIFKHQGYKVMETARSGDYGVDLVITKDNVRTAVQIKRYKGKVNQAAVREVVAGKVMKIYNAEKSMVVTNSTFTRLAYDLANAHACELVDRDKLGEWILEFQSLKI